MRSLKQIFLPALPLCFFSFWPLLYPNDCKGSLNQNNDVQLWITESVQKNVFPSWALNFANEWRFGNNASQLYFFYLQGTIEYTIRPWIWLGPGYRQIWQIQAGRWERIYEPLIELCFQKRKESGSLQWRNRFSYLIRQEGGNVWQYRGRVRFMESWGSGNRYSAYVSNELFLHSDEGCTQDRLSAGTIFPLFYDPLKADCYYVLRFLKSNDHWTHQHILGLWLSFFF